MQRELQTRPKMSCVHFHSREFFFLKQRAKIVFKNIAMNDLGLTCSQSQEGVMPTQQSQPLSTLLFLCIWVILVHSVTISIVSLSHSNFFHM